MIEIDHICFESSTDLCENHQNLQKRTIEKLKSVLSQSSLLHDIDYDIAPDELESQIAMVTGDSIKVYLRRDPFSKLKLSIPVNGSTVATLKKAIKWKYTVQQRREHNRKNEKNSNNRVSTSHRNEQKNTAKTAKNRESITTISWKYVWRTYYLEHNGEYLKDNKKILTEYGIKNKSVLTFEKKSKERKKLKR